jgi:hypothetical protein
MRHAGFTIKHRTRIPQKSHHFALIHLLFPRTLLPLKSSNPAHIPHARLDTFDVKLVLEGDWHAM